MKRRLFNFAAVISTMLCVVIVPLWVLSYRHPVCLAHVHYADQSVTWRGLGSQAGKIVLIVRVIDPPDTSLFGDAGWHVEPGLSRYMRVYLENGPSSEVRVLGCQYFRERFPPRFGNADATQSVWVLTFPHAGAVLLSIILPLVLLRRISRRHALTGFCPTCGYDLRATPEKCPECGTIGRADGLSESAVT